MKQARGEARQSGAESASPESGSTSPTQPTADRVKLVADLLWSNLDLNGHTLDGVNRTASRIITALEASSHKRTEAMLGDLLAVIHRDGGHYIAEHGLQKAWTDALALSSERISELDTMQAARPIVPEIQDMGAEKAKRTLLGIEIPRDELALRIAIQCLSMRPPMGLTATEALNRLAARQSDIIDGFRRAADASVLFFYECVEAGKQPS